MGVIGCRNVGDHCGRVQKKAAARYLRLRSLGEQFGNLLFISFASPIAASFARCKRKPWSQLARQSIP